MPEPLPITVIGGGPAGASAAATLARAGRAVTVIEERPGWEKPCGGGVTDKALREFPFLAEAGIGCNWIRRCEITSPDGRRVAFALDRPVAIYARRHLNAWLLERARSAGARVLEDRVVGAAATGTGWRLQLRGGGRLEAGAVVMAAGARAALDGPWAARWHSRDLMATAGYYLPLERLPWPGDGIVIQFLEGLEGYIWSFPRGDHASVGICGGLATEPTAALRRRLEEFLESRGIGYLAGEFYAHVLPAPRPATLRAGRYEGGGGFADGWARVGDAAGLVDALTGEGLYYALRSGVALGEAWAAGAAYEPRLRRELLPELELAAGLAPRFYHGRFAGGRVLDRMTLFTARSRRFRGLMCDLFSGAQAYAGLRRRLYVNFAPALLEMLVS